MYEDEANYVEAENVYRKAVERQSEFPEAYFNVGDFLREVGRRQAAKEMFLRAVEQDQTWAEAWDNLVEPQILSGWRCRTDRPFQSGSAAPTLHL